MDDGLLQTGELRVTHLHAQVPAGHHDHIARVDDAGEIVDGLVALDLGDQARLAAGGAQQRARLLHVGGVARERHRHVIHALLGDELDVLVIARRHRGRRDAAALTVDPLAIGELAADAHAGVDGRGADTLDVQHDLPVIEQQRVTGGHVARQILVGDAHPRGGAGLGIERGVERESGAFGKLHAAVAKTLDADLGSPQIQQHADALVGALRGLAHQRQSPPAVRDRAVRGVEARNVEPGAHHLREHLE